MMSNTVELCRQLTQARNELNNLRKRLQGLQAQHRKDVSHLEKLLAHGHCLNGDFLQGSSCKPNSGDDTKLDLLSGWKPIGHIISWFRTKNGTPRQGSVSSLSRGIMKVDKSVFNNPQHALEGLHEYSHVWIFFVFDQNEDKGMGHSKTKVAPPRLNGERVGVFATRSPHRPNPLGLTLARLERVQGDCLYLSGLDILDGTPVLDIKPYIPQYDAPQPLSSASENFAAQERRNETRDCGLFQGKNSENVTEIIVKENSYCSVTIAGGSQPNNKHKMKQNAPNSKLVCTEENPGGKKSQREFLKEKLSLKKVNETMSDTKIVNHLSLKQCDGRVLQPSEESGRDECNDSGNLNFSSTNCGKDLIACDKGDFASCRFKENSTSRINKGKKSHSTLGNKKHIKAQNHQVTCKPLNPSGDVGRVEEVTTASWLEAPPSSSLQVIFNPIAEAQVKLFSKCAEKECYRLEFLEDGAELTSAISSVLSEDPRSAYRRQKCSSLLYYFAVDSAHITAWFEGGTAEVLRVHPLQANMQRETSET